MRMRKESDEVLYPDEPVVSLGPEDVARLKEAARANPRRRIRLCAHANVADDVHEMLIVHERDAYVRPHKHTGKSESFHVVEGRAKIVLFDDSGEPTRVVELGDSGSGLDFYHRMSEPLFHTVVIGSDALVFFETKPGPFDPAETVFADWAPAEDEAGKRYLSELRTRIEGAAPGARPSAHRPGETPEA